jgi:hypothetical protein
MLLMGGDTVNFGRDDIIDFLSQYGEVKTIGGTTLYVSAPGDNIPTKGPALFCHEINLVWTFTVWTSNYYMLGHEQDLLAAVEKYLTIKTCKHAKEPVFTKGVGLPDGGWVWGVEGKGLPRICSLPRRFYLRLRGQVMTIFPRERGDSPLKVYATREAAMNACHQAGLSQAKP